MSRRLIPVVVCLALTGFGGTCIDPRASPPPTSTVDDAAAFEAQLVRVRTVDGASTKSIDTDGTNELWSAGRLGREVYASCIVSLGFPNPATIPSGAARLPFDTCPAVSIAPNTDNYLPSAPASCSAAVCLAHASACTAEMLMEIAAELEPFESRYVPLPTSGTFRHFRVPVQSKHAQVAILETAVAWATHGMTTSGENLRRGLGRYPVYSPGVTVAATTTFPGVCDASNNWTDGVVADTTTNVSVSYPETLSMLFAQTANLVSEAGIEVANAHAALADATMSQTTSNTSASRNAWVGRYESRARAAHVLVGGGVENGLNGVPNGYGTYGSLSSDAQRALAFVRRAGYYSTSNVAPASYVSNVAARISTAAVPVTSTSLLEDAGLSLDDWTAAQNKINEDAALFMLPNRLVSAQDTRNLSAIAPPDALPVHESLGRVRLGASVSTVLSRDIGEDRPSELTSLAAYPNTAAGFEMGYPIGVGYARLSVAHATDYAASVVYDVTAALDASSLTGPMKTAMNDVLRPAATTLSTARIGRVEVCKTVTSTMDNTQQLVGRLPGATGEYRLVRSIDGVRCATIGRLQGTSCALTPEFITNTGTGTVIPSTPTAPRAGTGFGSGGIRWNWNAATGRYYIVRSTRGTVAAGQEVPGAWREVASFYVLTAGQLSGVQRCNYVPVTPAIDARAAQLVSPSVTVPDEPSVTCAGLPNDQRIPLEDELTTDGDPAESSWRHYLTLAREAATTADLLGEDVVDKGLTIEQRVEVATSALETECGGPLDIDWLTGSSIPNASISCPIMSEGTVVGGSYVCRNGVPIFDIGRSLQARASSDPGAAKLLQCIGDVSTVPYATIGNRPLCLWENPSTGAICENASTLGVACPLELSTTATDATTLQSLCATRLVPILASVPGSVAKAVTTTLGIFDDRVPDGSSGVDGGGPVVPPLEDLQILRAETGTVGDTARYEAYLRLIAHPWMRQSSVRALASRMGWTGRPWDFSAIERDGSEWATTGDPFAGGPSTSGWPCAATYPDRNAALCAAGMTPMARSLSCSGMSNAANCAAPGPVAYPVGTPIPDAAVSGLMERVMMNHRMARAVLALRVITGAGLADFAYPHIKLTEDAWGSDKVSSDYSVLDQTDQLALAPNPNHAGAPGYDLTPVLRFGGIRYNEYTGVNSSWTVKGDGACMDIGGLPNSTTGLAVSDPRYQWTHLAAAYGGDPGVVAACPTECLLGICHASPCSRVIADCHDRDRIYYAQAPYYVGVVFERGGSQLLPSSYTNSVNYAWEGLGDVNDPTERHNGLHGLIRRALDAVYLGQNDKLIEGSSEGELRPLSDYWANSLHNSVHIARAGLTPRDIVDGLELAAMIDTRTKSPTCSPSRFQNIAASGEADIARLEEYTRCAADSIEENAQRMVFREIPQDVVDAIRNGNGSGESSRRTGQRGAAVDEVAASIVTYRSSQIEVAARMREMSQAAQTLRVDLERLGIARSRVNIALSRDIANQMTDCLTSTTGTIYNFLDSASASLKCANAAVQISLAITDANLQKRGLSIDEDQLYDNYTASFHDQMDRLGVLSNDVDATRMKIQSQLTSMETSRQAAIRAFGDAMLYSTDTAGRHLYANTVLRRRFTTAQSRYRAAHEHAMRMAFLARIAIEQRLGIRMRDMHDRLSLVEAPANWESTICTHTGIDYARIRAEQGDNSDNYAEAFIGSYVDRLERVVESYRLDYPFHEGTDTAVISLRDNVYHTRDVCPAPGAPVANLLGGSATLLDPQWSVVGCPLVTNPSDPTGEQVVRNCVTSGHLPTFAGQAARPTPTTPELGAGEVNSVVIGDRSGRSAVMSALGASRLAQNVTLTAGRYLLSWYGYHTYPASIPTAVAPALTGTSLSAASAVRVSIDGVPIAIAPTAKRVDTGADCPSNYTGECRFHAFFTVPSTATVEIAVKSPAADTATVNPARWTALGKFQLESLARIQRGVVTINESNLLPGSFVVTSAPGRSASALPVCEDTHGNRFREGWRHDCLRLCPDGFSRACADASTSLYCYWERSFEIGPSELEAAGDLERAGFAIGNYNYRFESVALNFVGSNIRTCEFSTNPSQCNSSGNVPYSIEHAGPFQVRNFGGDLYTAPLFAGRIEHARGLAAERYLTNPLSSADRSLVEPYTRYELRGRPLTGAYVIRIWDTGEVNFNEIEDIQVLLGYRYWTRFN